MPEEINHEGTDLPVCPWCGYADDAYFEYHEGPGWNCGRCGKLFDVVSMETSVTFWTQKSMDIKCFCGYHNIIPAKDWDGKSNIYCRKCGKGLTEID